MADNAMSHIPVQLQEQDDKTWIAIPDAARILDIGEGTVRWYASQGKFQRSGRGRGMRVLLGDVRKYASHRNPDKRLAGKLAGKALSENRKRSKIETVEQPEAGVFETALSARSELADLNDRLTLLLTRKAELEEVIRAVETIERFARLKPEEEIQNVE